MSEEDAGNLVLIVDDDAIVRETVSEILESNGYQTVAVASTGR